MAHRSSLVEKLDPLETLVPPGNYIVLFASADLKKGFWQRDIWYLKFRIMEGEHEGELLLFPVNVDPSKNAARSSVLSKTYVTATGKRPPQHLNKIKPEKYLRGLMFEAKVRDVVKDSNHNKRPRDASYSRVDHLIKVVQGAPTA